MAEIVDSINIDDIFQIDEANIIEAYSKQSALYARFAVMHAEADAVVGKTQAARDEEYAAADDHYRHDMDRNGEKYTEAKVKAFIELDENYRKAVDDYIQADYICRKVKAIVRALEMRAEMLVSMGAHLRHEMNMTDMNIRDARYAKIVGNLEQEARAQIDRIRGVVV
jgi:hypothetical protein